MVVNKPVSNSDGTASRSCEMVERLQVECVPRQQILLSLLAVCDRHDIEPAELVDSLAKDLPRTPFESRRKTRKFFWARVQRFADALRSGKSVSSAMEESSPILPETVQLAVRLEEKKGSLGAFYDAWLNRSPDVEGLRTPDPPPMSRMVPLFGKALLVLYFSLVLLVFIVPQLKEIIEEFALEPPFVLQLAVDVGDFLAGNWFWLILIFLVMLPLLKLEVRHYFRRWNLFIWKQPVLSKSVLVRQAMALFSYHDEVEPRQATQGLPKLSRIFGAAVPLDNRQTARQGTAGIVGSHHLSASEKRALETARSAETQAWLLWKRAAASHQSQRVRKRAWSRFLVLFGNTVIGGFVLLFVVAVISFLVAIIQQLS